VTACKVTMIMRAAFAGALFPSSGSFSADGGVPAPSHRARRPSLGVKQLWLAFSFLSRKGEEGKKAAVGATDRIARSLSTLSWADGI
jgi:hypothetical protein